MAATLFHRTAIAALTLAGVAGCELLKHNAEAQVIVNGRAVGMAAGDFFDRYGRPNLRRELGDGTTEYDWLSQQGGYVPPGPGALDEHVCRLRIATDRRGRISAALVVYDAPGKTSISRCGEIFAAP